MIDKKTGVCYTVYIAIMETAMISIFLAMQMLYELDKASEREQRQWEAEDKLHNLQMQLAREKEKEKKEKEEEENHVHTSYPDMMWSKDEDGVYQYLKMPLILTVNEKAEHNLTTPEYCPISPDIKLLQDIEIQNKELNSLIDLLEQGVYHEDKGGYIAIAAQAQIAKFVCLPNAQYTKEQSERILNIVADYLKKSVVSVPHIVCISITNNQMLNKYPELADKILDVSKSMLIDQENQKSEQTLNPSNKQQIIYNHRYEVIQTALRDIQNIQILYPNKTPEVINALADIASQNNIATYAHEHSADTLGEIYAKQPDTLPIITDTFKNMILTLENERSIQECYQTLERLGDNHPKAIPDICNVYKEIADAKNTDFYTNKCKAYTESLVFGRPEYYEILLDNCKETPPNFTKIGSMAEHRPDLADRFFDLTCRCIEDENIVTSYNPFDEGMEVLRYFVSSDFKYADKYLDAYAKYAWYHNSEKDADMAMAIATRRPDLNQKINDIIAQKLDGYPLGTISKHLSELHKSLQKYIRKDPKYIVNAKQTMSFLNNLRIECKVKSMPEIDKEIYSLSAEFKTDKHAKDSPAYQNKDSASLPLTKKQKFDFLKIARRYMIAEEYTENRQQDFDEIKLVKHSHIIAKQIVDNQTFYFIVPVKQDKVADNITCLKAYTYFDSNAQKHKVRIQVDQFANNKITSQIVYDGIVKSGFDNTEEFTLADYCKQSFITKLTPSGRKLAKINDVIEKYIMSPHQYQAEKAKRQTHAKSQEKPQKKTRSSDGYQR